MANIPREFIDNLLARSNIVDIISPFVSLKKAGKEYKACCPFHKEKTPSFTVSIEKNFYHCFGCQKHGDPISFLMDFHKYTYVEAVGELAKQYGLIVPVDDSQPSKPAKETLEPYYALHELATRFFQEQLQRHPASVAAQKYLQKRGLQLGTIEQFAIGYAPPGWDNFMKHALGHQFTLEQCVKAGLVIEKEGKYYDRFRQRVMFPIRDQRGRVIAFGGRVLQAEDTPKYLNSPESPIFHKGSELYGLWESSQQSTIKGIIVVEGYMDVVMLAQYHIAGAVATLGTATTPEHIQKCFRHHTHIIFCFDGDTAGKKAAWRALETCLPLLKQNQIVRFMFLPQDEDPDTFVQKFGTDAFTGRLQQAQPLPDFFFSHLMEKSDLRHLDQKAQLANTAAPMITQIQDGILKELMFNTLSQYVQLPLAILKEVHKSPTTLTPTLQATSTPRIPAATKQSWRQTSLQKLPSPMRLAISLLVQQPRLFQLSLELTALQASPLPGMPLLQQLMTFIQQHNIQDSATLLAQWPDPKSHPHLVKCAQYNHCIPETGIEEEFKGTLLRLREHHQHTLIDHLLARAQETGLSDAEKKELNDLLLNLRKQ